MKDILALSISLFLLTVLTLGICSFQVAAELSPSTYADMQESAGEKLHIRVVEVDTSGWLRNLLFRDVRVTIQAEVLQVDRSVSGLAPGKTIYISYIHNKLPDRMVGPSAIPILSEGAIRPAFLEHDEGNVYVTAARSWSFKPERIARDLEPISFAYGSVIVRREELRKVQACAELMLKYPGLVVLIEGHTDERGTEDYNLSLGERMAQAVKDKLVESGVSNERLRVFSYGEERPVAFGHDEAAWSRNRRVEVKVFDRYQESY